MFRVISMLLLLFAYCGFAINFYPIPSSITDTFRVSSYYGVFQFRSLDGGQLETKLNREGYGFGFKWGNVFDGFELVVYHIDFKDIAESGSLFYEFDFNINSFKLRYYFPLAKDHSGQMSLFVSYGLFNGDTVSHSYSEQISANSATIKRQFKGAVADSGVVFNYQFNYDWHIYLFGLYQISFNEVYQNPNGQSVDGLVRFNGAEVGIGTSMRL